MSDNILKSVKEIFSDAIENKKYVIPSYQRGYKWNREDVIKLLDDLMSFERGNAKDFNSFYCIQNITLVPLKDRTGWNVIDGQQRLTTLYILLSYLRYKYKDEETLSFFSSSDCIRYDVRESTREFLSEQIFSGTVWDNDINPDEASSKDLWYILDVAKGIEDWFDKDENHLTLNIITNRTKLIVNNISSNTVSEEVIFAGLNGGKVDLDGADLVRAILITRSAKQKYKDGFEFKVPEYRAKIALELDGMNLWWGEDEQRKFFEQFLPGNELKNSIFNHSLHPIGLLYKLYYLAYCRDDEKFGVEFFENGRNFNTTQDDDHWELYESLMNLHHSLNMWFSDYKLYHWIGYLMFRFKGQSVEIEDEKITISFKNIWQIWKRSDTKTDFLGKVLLCIQRLLKNSDDKLIEKIKDVKTQWYGKAPNGITNVLILMDVLFCTGLYRDCWNKDKIPGLKLKDQKEGKYRLPVAFFNKAGDQFEHIRSCSPNEKEGKDVRDKKEWGKHIKNIYSTGDHNSEESQMKDSLLEILQKAPDDLDLDDIIIEKLNQKMNEYGQHSIGNIALLDGHINESYQNQLFQEKIQRIFKEFMLNERYIRPYTMILFETKINDTDKVWRWTKKDIQDNAANIAKNVELFLNIKL